MKRYQDKVCVITASSTGIGFGIARRLGQEGGKILISSRSQKHVDEALGKLRAEGIVCEGIVCHVLKDRKKLIDVALEKFGGIDVLVNNAAVSTHMGPSLTITEEAYDKMFDTNVKAAFFLTKEALPHLIKSQGKVMFVSSVGGYLLTPGLGVYSATKTTLLGIVKNLAAELAHYKIRVNGIAPGVILTKFAEAIAESEEVKKHPAGRIGYVEDCVGVVAFLCSNEADYISGETIVINGGASVRL